MGILPHVGAGSLTVRSPLSRARTQLAGLIADWSSISANAIAERAACDEAHVLAAARALGYPVFRRGGAWWILGNLPRRPTMTASERDERFPEPAPRPRPSTHASYLKRRSLREAFMADSWGQP